MAQVIGDLEVTLHGVTYTLHMGFREIGLLQQTLGMNLTPLLVQPEAGGLPDMLAYIRCVEVALTRYHSSAPATVADDILALDPGIVPRLLAVAFPDARPGKPKAAARSGSKPTN